MYRSIASPSLASCRSRNERLAKSLSAGFFAALSLTACSPKVTESEGDIGRAGVDLAITGLRVFQDPVQTSSMVVELDVTANILSVDVDVRIWLSTPEQPFVEVYLLDSGQVPVAGSASISRLIRADAAGANLGTYVLNCGVDVVGPLRETWLANNMASWPLTLTLGALGKPDLEVSNGSTSVASTSLLGPGSLVQVNGSVINSGQESSGPFRIGVYASTDATITRADNLLGYVNMADLEPLATRPFQASFNTTGLGVNAAYEIGWIADPDGVTGEADTNDNEGVAWNGPVIIGSTFRPDLTTAAEDATISTYNIPNPGSPFSVTFQVRNRGNAPASSCSASLYASLDANVTASDFMIGTAPVPALSPLGAANVTLASANTTSLATGQEYHIGWIIDPTNFVLEFSKANNASQLPNRVSVGAAPARPDLATQALGSSIEPTIVATAGLPARILCEIRNVGAAASPDCVVQFYASADATISTSDFLLGTTTIASLAAGETTVCTLPVAVTTSLTNSASYFVGWMVDPFGAITEVSKSNNRAAATTQLSISGSAQDLSDGTPISFTVPPNTIQPFRINAPIPASNLQVTITGSGDADLYVKRSAIAWPAQQGRHDTADFKAPYLPGSSESVTFVGPTDGTWWVFVHGYQSSWPSSGTIVATWDSTAPTAWVRETPHPYANSTSYVFTYSAPGATEVGVHFDRISTELDWDFLYIRNQQGAILYTVSGDRIFGGLSTFGEVFDRTDGWCYVAGSSLTIELVTDSLVTDYGFRTDLAYASY